MGLIEQIEQLAAASGYSFSYGDEYEQNYNVDQLDIDERPVLALLPMVSSGSYENGTLTGREVSAVVSLGVKGGGEAPPSNPPRWATLNGMTSIIYTDILELGDTYALGFRLKYGGGTTLLGLTNGEGYGLRIDGLNVSHNVQGTEAAVVLDEAMTAGREYVVTVTRDGQAVDFEISQDGAAWFSASGTLPNVATGGLVATVTTSSALSFTDLTSVTIVSQVGTATAEILGNEVIFSVGGVIEYIELSNGVVMYFNGHCIDSLTGDAIPNRGFTFAEIATGTTQAAIDSLGSNVIHTKGIHYINSTFEDLGGWIPLDGGEILKIKTDRHITPPSSLNVVSDGKNKGITKPITIPKGDVYFEAMLYIVSEVVANKIRVRTSTAQDFFLGNVALGEWVKISGSVVLTGDTTVRIYNNTRATIKYYLDNVIFRQNIDALVVAPQFTPLPTDVILTGEGYKGVGVEVPVGDFEPDNVGAYTDAEGTTLYSPAMLAYFEANADRYEFFDDDCKLGGYEGETIPSTDIVTGEPVEGARGSGEAEQTFTAQSTRDETRREKYDNRLGYLSGALKEFIMQLAQLDGVTMTSDHIIEQVNKYDANLEFVVAEITFEHDEAISCEN